jgi:hypothetical protein
VWYLCVSRPRGEEPALLERIRELRPQHFQWLREQDAAGRLLFSGPTSDNRIGIMVVRARSLDDARRIFDSETWHAAGLRDYELHEWEVHQAVGVGTFTVEAADAVFGHADEQ